MHGQAYFREQDGNTVEIELSASASIGMEDIYGIGLRKTCQILGIEFNAEITNDPHAERLYQTSKITLEGSTKEVRKNLTKLGRLDPLIGRYARWAEAPYAPRWDDRSVPTYSPDVFPQMHSIIQGAKRRIGEKGPEAEFIDIVEALVKTFLDAKMDDDDHYDMMRISTPHDISAL